MTINNFKICTLLLCFLTLSQCSTIQKGVSSLNLKSNVNIYQKRDFDNPDLNIHSNITQRTTQNELRHQLESISSGDLNWGRGCDCL